MERCIVFLDWKNQYCENDHTTQGNLQIQCNPNQITNGIFHRTKTKHCKISMETQKHTLSSKNYLEKNELQESYSLISNYTAAKQYGIFPSAYKSYAYTIL